MTGKTKKLLVYCLVLVMCLYNTLGTTITTQASGKKASSITLTVKSMSLIVGQTYQLKVKTVKPQKADKSVTWKSSNSRVAKVSSKGKVTALKAGKTTITAVSKSNKKAKASCTITVYSKVKSIELNYTNRSILEEEAFTLFAFVNPENARQEVTYSSSNSKIASVTKDGLVVGKKAGKACITVTSKYDKKKKAFCTVVVESDETAPEITDKPVNTPTPTGIIPPKPTHTSEPTPMYTATPKPTNTLMPTNTPNPTNTPKPTNTPNPTNTLKPTDTPKPTNTPTPTNTPKPTNTATPTNTPTPTPVKATGIYLKTAGESCSYANVKLGESTGKHIEVAYTPSGAAKEKITWSSSVSGILSIAEEENGVYIFGEKQGTTTLKATTESGLSTSCIVTVGYCLEPVLMYKADGKFYPLDCKEMLNTKTISKNTQLYVREYLDCELLAGSKVVLNVTDINAESGKYRTYEVKWDDYEERNGVYGYFPVKIASQGETGSLRIYTKVVLSNNSEYFIQEKGSDDAFYINLIN